MIVNKNHFKVVNQATLDSDNIVLIIGAATDGPARVPILINDTKYNTVDIFGKSPLSDAYTAVKGTGVNQIIAYRINGIHSMATLQSTNETGIQDVMRLTCVSAGEKYNDIAITVYSDRIYIDETAIGGSLREYYFDQYPTVYSLAYGINRDAFYGLISLTAEPLIPDFNLINVVSSRLNIELTGGNDEADFIDDRATSIDLSSHIASTKDRLKEVLFGNDIDDQAEFIPNGSLASLNYGVVVLADIYHDDSPDYASMLGNFCLNKSKVSDSGCIGVIGVSPLFDTSDVSISTKVQSLIGQSNSDEQAEWNKYVQIIVGDSYYSQDMPVVSNAYGYAGAQSFYSYYIMMTNKKISGFGYLNWQISKEDVALLTSNGYICIVPSIRRGFVPYQATTYYKDKASPMSKPHCVRISQHASRELMYAFDDLIGAVSNYYTKKEISKTAQDVLQVMVDRNAIQSFTLQCTFTPGDKEVTISSSIVPYAEVTAVTSTTVIEFPKEVI